MIDNIFFLNMGTFNAKYSIKKMNNNSITIMENESGKEYLVHKRVLNTILNSKELLACSYIEREYKGKKDMWLATFFTI